MAVVTRDLWAKQGEIRFPDGKTVPFWGFATAAGGDPVLPGPVIKAKVGDIIIINLQNNLNEYASLVFPGQDVVPEPVKDKGVFVSYNSHAAPGGSVKYIFTATRPGVFLYESGTSPEKQVAMGLYGVIAVYPWEIFDNFGGFAYGPNTGSYFDMEKILVLSEVDSRFNMSTAGGSPFNMLDFEPDYWLVNGRAYPHTLLPGRVDFLVNQPLNSKVNARYGRRILLRIINAGFQNHVFRLEGITARVIAVDSRPLISLNIDASYLKNTITIASGESYDLIFKANMEGQYFLHDHDYHGLRQTNRFPGEMAARVDVLHSDHKSPPRAPSGLSCSPLGTDAILLGWTNRSNNEEGFVVERKTEAEDFNTIDVLVEPGLTEYLDRTVQPGITYVYRIRAYNQAGFSGYSNQC